MGRHLPLILTVGFFLCLVAAVSSRLPRDREGHIIYALDDAYIHLAIAKNLTQHGVWGLTRYEFANASSSPGWTLLMAAGYAVADDPRSLPLLLNVVCAVLFLSLAHVILLRAGIQGVWSAGVMMLVMLSVPLPALVFTGMEHTLHLVVHTAFVACIALTVAGAQPPRWTLWAAPVLAALLLMVRFEGIFAVAIAAVLLLVAHRRFQAFILLAAAALPVLVLGVISLSQGSDILPNSVLVKGTPDIHTLLGWAKTLGKGAWFLVVTPGLPVPILAALLLLVFDKRLDVWKPGVGGLLAVQFVLVAALHMQLAKTGVFFRYEAYLVGVGLVCVAVYCREQLAAGTLVWPRPRLRSIAAAFLAVVIIAPLSVRAASLVAVEKASQDIFRQHYQMATFVQRYYNDATLALNDIGMVSYFTDIRLVDLWGLATTEVARLKRAGKYDTDQMRRVCAERKVDLVLAYPTWYGMYGGLPEDWLTVGEITMHGKQVAGSTRVGVYAFTPRQADKARRHLAEYSPEMPPHSKIIIFEDGQTAGGDTE